MPGQVALGNIMQIRAQYANEVPVNDATKNGELEKIKQRWYHADSDVLYKKQPFHSFHYQKPIKLKKWHL